MVLLVVIPQGFEPWTHALEGRCSNPTELRNQIGRKVTQILANKQTLATFFNKNFQHAFKHSPHAPQPATTGTERGHDAALSFFNQAHCNIIRKKISIPELYFVSLLMFGGNSSHGPQATVRRPAIHREQEQCKQQKNQEQ